MLYDDIPKHGYRGMRTLRSQHLAALLETLEERELQIQYSKKLDSISDDSLGVRAIFDDGAQIEADLILGCDDVHSGTGMAFVQPERQPVYSNVAIALDLVDGASITNDIHFKDTAFNMSQNGSLIASSCDSDATQVFFGLEGVALFTELLKCNREKQELSQTFAGRAAAKALHRCRSQRDGDEMEGAPRISWARFKMRQMAMPWLLWFAQNRKEEEFASDVRELAHRSLL